MQYAIVVKGSCYNNILLNSHRQNGITAVVNVLAYSSTQLQCAKLYHLHITYMTQKKIQSQTGFVFLLSVNCQFLPRFQSVPPHC